VNKAIESARSKRAHRVAQLQLQDLLQRLTRREREVYDLMRRGFNNAEIMAEMGVSLPTAKQYKGAVMRKMGVETLAQLMGLGQNPQAGQ
jgi:FixJ family two-component response regulator